MPKPTGPDRDDRLNAAGSDPEANAAEKPAADPADETTESYRKAARDAESATEVIAKKDPHAKADGVKPQRQREERRFTAPGFDAKETAIIETVPEAATEVFRRRQRPPTPAEPTDKPPRTAMPQLIPPRLGAKLKPSSQRSWGWVLALIVIILALTAVAVLVSVLLTQRKHPGASQEDQVRTTIQSFDVAMQNGDLAALRTMTCGNIRDTYVNYDEHEWADTYRRAVAAKQYPVVASIDQVVVNDGHAEANVTAFMAYAPQVRSTRSFDLQFRDDQWKICQSSTG